MAGLVPMEALNRAGIRIDEPVHRSRLEIPADMFRAMAPVVPRLRAVPETQELRGSSYMLKGAIPAARVHELQRA